MNHELHYQEKKKILNQFLTDLNFESCNNQTLAKTIESLNYSKGYEAIFFPQGIEDVLIFFSNEIDKELVDILLAKQIATLRVREKIFTLVKARLEIYNKSKEAIRSIASYYYLPNNFTQSIKMLWLNADNFWQIAGDQSTDFNFYSKRMILSTVYGSTLLYWLEDNSPFHQQTWEFLQRRIDNVMKINKIKLFNDNLMSNIKQVPFLRLVVRKFFKAQDK